MSAPPSLNQSEFESLLDPQLSLAFNLAYRVLNSREEAEDVVQNAAIRAWKSLGGYERGTNFKAWFLKIVVNLALNARRDATRRPVTVDVEGDESEAGFLYAQTQAAGWRGQDEPAQALLAKVQAQDVQSALANLPEDFRVVAALHFVQELSYEEIANVLDIPIGTVRSRLHRARKLLQRELWETAKEMGIAPKEPKSTILKSFAWIIFATTGTIAVWRGFGI